MAVSNPTKFLPIRVRSVRSEPLDIALLSPFGISGGAQEAANNALVRLELEDGTVGYGEAAPFPAYNGETQEAALAALAAGAAGIEGREASDCEALAAEFRRRGGHASGSAQCAFEMALLDALGRRERLPLWRWFGGGCGELETDMTITTGSPSEAADAARDIRRRGIRLIKVKVGGRAGVAADLARVRAISEAAPDSPLVLDANAGLSRADAGALARGLRDQGVTPALLEQWLAKDDLAGMRALHEETGWTVAADEAVTCASDALRVAAEGAAQVINIKLMKAGILEALQVAAAARSAGLGLMIGGNVESILAMTVSACFASGLGGFVHADLDTPLFLATNPFSGGYALTGGRISVAHIAAGHGVVPRAAAENGPDALG
jgi:L-alanine-DL-glutamate epimerase-like enolase superfamily enzyme